MAQHQPSSIPQVRPHPMMASFALAQATNTPAHLIPRAEAEAALAAAAAARSIHSMAHPAYPGYSTHYLPASASQAAPPPHPIAHTHFRPPPTAAAATSTAPADPVERPKKMYIITKKIQAHHTERYKPTGGELASNVIYDNLTAANEAASKLLRTKICKGGVDERIHEKEKDGRYFGDAVLYSDKIHACAVEVREMKVEWEGEKGNGRGKGGGGKKRKVGQ